MEERILELWINVQDKVVSFRQVPEWPHQTYESEESIQKQLDFFAAAGFRFQ
ncbi:MAG: hypothetical protein ACI3WR_06760 [Oscillospiraceae bacterium]